MKVPQYVDAQRLLPVITRAAKSGETITYKIAAKSLGRNPKTEARTVAQVCDLLDAAAALAGIPLLALIIVRESTPPCNINRKAWVKGFPQGIRKAIIQKSLRHTFTDEDFTAIKRSLENLSGKSNRAAWGYYYSIRPRQLRYQDLTRSATPPSQSLDALNDLGSDTPVRLSGTTSHYARNPAIRAAVMRRAGGKCELCGELSFVSNDGSRYLEAHHIIALANDGPDRMRNVIALCANHHREAHSGLERETLEQRMIEIVEQLES
jgi:hypothetical protein